jgi:O-antigen/teichoic acid export membrane protein
MLVWAAVTSSIFCRKREKALFIVRYNIEIAQAPDRLREEPMSPEEVALEVAPPVTDAPARVDQTGVELKRGAFLNTIAMLASNFRGIFTFLVARLLGAAALGLYSVAWSTTDIISKIGVLGLDNAITTFIARSEAVGDRARSRALFRVAIILGVAQSVITAGVVIIALRFFNNRLHVQPQLVAALALVLCAMPGLALYRISTAVSRGMKVMQHDIYSRGMTEPLATTLAFLLAFAVGFGVSSPQVAAVVGSAASGLIALRLASTLFRNIPAHAHVASPFAEARSLIAYAAPISVYQLINAFISRLDLLMLAYFVGRAPGVTLTTVGVYSAVIGTANGLRKVNQAFNPIFAPVVAGMTATGDHRTAATTYARLAEWMLWILLPLVAVLSLAGGIILLIYGPTFQQGGAWIGIVALASATNAFVSLGETVIMVQRPHLNLLHSSITCAVAAGGLLWLIPRFGAMGAAIGILLPYIVQGILRYATLRWVFHWKDSWSDIRPPLVAAGIAFIPALLCRTFLGGIVGQVISAAAFLAVFGVQWWRHHIHRKDKYS